MGEKLVKSFYLLIAAVLLIGMVLPSQSFAANDRNQEQKQLPLHENVVAAFEEEEFVKVLVLLDEQADTKSAAMEAQQNAAKAKLTKQKDIKELKGKAVVSALKQTADRSQKNLKAFLAKQKASGQVKDYESFYIVNGFAVTASKSVVEKMAEFTEVKTILLDEKQTLHPVSEETVKTATVQTTTDESIEWNINRVGAPAVWAKGITGEGTVVANIDSGVKLEHPALLESYRGYDPNNPTVFNHEFNWYDAVLRVRAPNDSDGHGTHTMGIMVGQEADGQNKIGVAPGAKWIAARAFFGGESYDSYLINAAQWVLAPTDANGVPHPEMAPDVVNNSWGGRPLNNDWFRYLVQAWREAGILPVFSVGNAGIGNPADPATASAPANYPEALAVGATTNTDDLASFSLRGPSERGDVKPDISAPGASIRSSLPGENWYTFTYGNMNGTSMAAPHVAAAALLLRDVDPELTVDEIVDILKLSATTKTDAAYPESPNNGYGYGLLNVLSAVEMVEAGIGTISGQVLSNGDDSIHPSYEEYAREVIYNGADAHFNISASDDISVNEVTLHVLFNGVEKTYQGGRVSGDHLNGSYEAVVPSDDIVGTSANYWWTIKDFHGNETVTDTATIAVADHVGAGYTEDFETYPDGWYSFGLHNSWQWGKPTYGPSGPASGEKLFGTNIRGRTEMFADMSLIMPPVKVEGSEELRFKQWYNMGRRDYATVYASEDGVNWIQLFQVSQTNKTWHEVGIDLSRFAGKTISIAFNLTTDDATVDGWYIDDVRLLAGGTQSSSESDDQNEVELKKDDVLAYPAASAVSVAEAGTGSLPVHATIEVVETGWKTKANPQNGKFTIHHPPGDYTLKIDAYGHQTKLVNVTLSSNGTIQPKVALAHAPKQVVSGVITDTEGNPVPNATIFLLEDEFLEPVHSDENGNYAFQSYVGDYTVQVFSANHYGKTEAIQVVENENITLNWGLQPFTAAEPAEIKYDNGRYNKNLVFGNKGNGFAVKMSLAEGKRAAKLKGAKLQFWAGHIPVPGGSDILISVYDAKDDGTPGNKLAGPIKATAQRNLSKWTEVDLSHLGLVLEDDFYILYSQADDYPYVPGFVSDGDRTNWAARSWDYIGGQWFQSNQSIGNYMIRAVVDYGVDTVPVAPKITLKNSDMDGELPFNVNVEVSPGSDTIGSVEYQLSTVETIDESLPWNSVELSPDGGEFSIPINEAGTWYTHVKVTDAEGMEELVSFGPFTVQAPIATPVVSNVDWENSELQIDWEAVDGVVEYVLERNGAEIYRGTETSFTDRGLARGETYAYSLFAVSEDGRSSQAAEFSFTVPIYTVEKMMSSDPYSNAMQFSSKLAENSLDAVLLVSGKDEAGIMLAGTLTNSLNAAVLLYHPEEATVRPELKAEVDRLLKEQGKVIILADNKDFSKALEKDMFNKFTDYTIERLKTHVSVAEKLQSPNRELFLVNVADSNSLLSTVQAANKHQIPVLQNAPGKLNSDVRKFIRDQAIRKVTVVGTFDHSIQLELQKLGVTVERIDGGSAELTAFQIAKKYYPSISNTIIVKTDQVANYLSVSRLALDGNSPILFTAERDRLIDEVIGYLNEQPLEHYYLLGELNEEIVEF